MKAKRILIAALGLSAVLACQKKEQQGFGDQGAQRVPISFTVATEVPTAGNIAQTGNMASTGNRTSGTSQALEGTTKAFLSENSVIFNPGDKISVWDGVANNCFTSEEGGAEAVFSGEAGQSETFLFLSPYNADATFSDGTIITAIPAVQTATLGGVDPKALVSAGIGSSSSKDIWLHNAVGLVKIIVPAGLAVKEIQVAGGYMANQSIAGKMSFNTAGDTVSPVEKGGKKISVVSLVPAEGQSTIGAGTYYVAVLPSVYVGGLTISFIDDKDRLYTRQSSSQTDVEVKRSHILPVGSLNTSDYKSKLSNEVFCTGLPVVVIQTKGKAPIVQKEEWMPGASMRIYDTDHSLIFDATTNIRGRGNSTWGYPKKPYAIKLDKKAEVMGMPKHKRWCLLANYMDRTLIRNSVATQISRSTGLEWTPSGKFVELILNGRHMGNYWLCEQIKVDENRVNISDRGQLFEADTWYDEQYKFMSGHYNYPYMFKDPDEVTPEHFAFCENYINEMEATLKGLEVDGQTKAITDYLDYVSFIDYWFVYEIAHNLELSHPKSTYMSMDCTTDPATGAESWMLKAGPVWDFDWGTFLPGTLKNNELVKGEYKIELNGVKAFYYHELEAQDAYRQLRKQRWNAQRTVMTKIPAYIDSLAVLLEKSEKLNSALWPITEKAERNFDEKFTFMAAVGVLKRAFIEKYNFLDEKIGGNSSHLMEYVPGEYPDPVPVPGSTNTNEGFIENQEYEW